MNTGGGHHYNYVHSLHNIPLYNIVCKKYGGKWASSSGNILFIINGHQAGWWEQVQDLVIFGLQICYFSGSGFSTFRCPGFASLRAPVFALSGTRGVYFFGLRFFYFSMSGVCIFAGSGFSFFRAPVSASLGTWGVYLFGLRFFNFWALVSSFLGTRGVYLFGLLFLFFGLRFLHFSAPELCIFSGSAFSTFWALPGTPFGIWGLHFCRLCFCPFRAPVFAILGTRGLFHFGLRFLHPKFASLWLQFLHSWALLVTV